MNVFTRFFNWILEAVPFNTKPPVPEGPRTLGDLNPKVKDGSGGWEWDFSKSRGCPDCGSHLFHSGPSGGAAMNIKCAGCGSKFWFGPPFTPQRIHNDDAFYYGSPKKLEDL